MEATLQTKCYQDPQEFYEKRFSWNVIFDSANPSSDTPIHIIADDWSGREITLPLGVLEEIIAALRVEQPVV